MIKTVLRTTVTHSVYGAVGGAIALGLVGALNPITFVLVQVGQAGAVSTTSGTLMGHAAIGLQCAALGGLEGAKYGAVIGAVRGLYSLHRKTRDAKEDARIQAIVDAIRDNKKEDK